MTHGSRHPGHPKSRGRGNSLQPRTHANPGAARRARFRRGRGAPPEASAPTGELPPARADPPVVGGGGKSAPRGHGGGGGGGPPPPPPPSAPGALGKLGRPREPR